MRFAAIITLSCAGAFLFGCSSSASESDAALASNERADLVVPASPATQSTIGVARWGIGMSSGSALSIRGYDPSGAPTVGWEFRTAIGGGGTSGLSFTPVLPHRGPERVLVRDGEAVAEASDDESTDEVVAIAERAAADLQAYAFSAPRAGLLRPSSDGELVSGSGTTLLEQSACGVVLVDNQGTSCGSDVLGAAGACAGAIPGCFKPRGLKGIATCVSSAAPCANQVAGLFGTGCAIRPAHADCVPPADPPVAWPSP